MAGAKVARFSSRTGFQKFGELSARFSGRTGLHKTEGSLAELRFRKFWRHVVSASRRSAWCVAVSGGQSTGTSSWLYLYFVAALPPPKQCFAQRQVQQSRQNPLHTHVVNLSTPNIQKMQIRTTIVNHSTKYKKFTKKMQNYMASSGKGRTPTATDLEDK